MCLRSNFSNFFFSFSTSLLGFQLKCSFPTHFWAFNIEQFFPTKNGSFQLHVSLKLTVKKWGILSIAKRVLLPCVILVVYLCLIVGWSRIEDQVVFSHEKISGRRANVITGRVANKNSTANVYPYYKIIFTFLSYSLLVP